MKQQKIRDFTLGAMATVLVLAILGRSSAQQPPPSYPCPDGATSCIVVTMTPEEVKSLTMPGGVYDQAEWANRSGMQLLIQQWKQKLATAPAGEVKKKEDAKPPLDTHPKADDKAKK